MSMSLEEQRQSVIETPSSKRRHNEMTSGLLHRVRSEFLEMPGLQLTSAQAARFWALDRLTSERILDGLMKAGFLFRNGKGAYMRASVG